MSIRETLAKLIAANSAYRSGTSTIPDAEYDALEDALAAMAVANPTDVDSAAALSFLASVGDAVGDTGWTKATHKAPMGSLSKSQTADEFSAWYTNHAQGNVVVVSDKLDGISISLQYKDGKLVQALTRGDGVTGEDITRNVVKMKGIVHVIPGFNGHLRGEIVLRRSDWKKHFPTYSNPRNAASGIAKRLDGDGSEHLSVYHYQMMRDSSIIARKEIEFMALQRIGCLTPQFSKVDSLAGVLQVYQDYMSNIRESLDYDIDGIVIDVDDNVIHDQLGERDHRPLGSRAFKFPHQMKPSVLRDIVWQVGKSGRITPVANFDTVNLAGADISKATLHNIANIERITRLAQVPGYIYPTVGSTILVSRQNDVIPGVAKVLTIDKVGARLTPPDNCPACGTDLVMEGEYLMCKGEDCSAQVLGAISRWVKKTGILGLGDSIIEALIDHAGVSDPSDLYLLDPKRIEGIPTGSNGSRLGRSASVIVDEIKSKAEMPLYVLVGSIGIPLCSRSVVKSIQEAGYDTLDKMYAARVNQIAALPGMGDTKANAFVSGLAVKRSVLDRLVANGVRIKAPSTGVLVGKSVCLTGFRSPELDLAIEDAGGTLKSSVGKGLTYLVAKDPGSGSEKLKKATTLGVTVVGVDEMWKILGR